jgi:hypothetical protein
MEAGETIDPGQIDRERLRARAERIRDSGALGRSSLQLRLFDLLLAASLEGRTPKESEIAGRLLGAEDFDGAVDGSVRVAVHRLRRKLEEAQSTVDGREAERLVIPRGSYRLALVGAADLAAQAADEPLPAAPVGHPGPSRRRRLVPAGRFGWPLLAAGLAALAIAGWGYSFLFPPRSDAERAAGGPLWAPLAAADRPTVIVVGDYYIFGELDDRGQVQRLIREFAINSRTDLDTFLMYNPDQVDRLRNLDLTYLPTGSAAALRSLVPVIDAAVPAEAPPTRVMTMSELTPELMKEANIVYIGYLSGLGLVRNALFAASRFEVGESYDELVDERTGNRYFADGPDGGRGPTKRGYGYIAAMPGPTGNRIVIIAGTRDAALMQAAEIARDPAAMPRPAPSEAAAFESLYAVGALGNLNVTGRPIVSSPMRTGDLWVDRAAPRNFPDQLTAPDR